MTPAPFKRLLGTFATTIGKAHVRAGMPNQDAAGVVKIGRRGIAVAVADGAGSAAHAEIGSRIAVDAILEHLTQNHRSLLDGIDPSGILEPMLVKLSEKALVLGCDVRQLATTLLGVVAIRRKNEVTWFALHVGDGIIVGDFGERPQIISRPENGEFGNSTFFVTDCTIQNHLRIYRGVAQNAKFALLTDGAAESLYHRNADRLAGAFSTLFNWADRVDTRTFKKALKQNLEDIITRKTTDDATIAIISIKASQSKQAYTPPQ